MCHTDLYQIADRLFVGRFIGGDALAAVNLIMPIIMIVFLGQGVWSAAFTSCLAMAIGSVITLILFRKKRMDLYYTKGKVEKAVFFRILVNSSSEFFSSISMSIMSIVFNFFLLKYGGTTAVAFHFVIRLTRISDFGAIYSYAFS